MQIFKNKPFARLPEVASHNATLQEAVGRADRGMIDADLGGGVIKQLLPREAASMTTS